jgi:ketosteroid isomerase-like protein
VNSLEVADRLFAAIEAGDVDTVRGLYSPDAVIWHNTDGVEQTVEENLRTLSWVVRNLAGRRYDVTHRVATDDGFLQEHVLRAQAPVGVLALPACIVCTVVDGRITRLAEYLDSAHVGPLTRPPA